MYATVVKKIALFLNTWHYLNSFWPYACEMKVAAAPLKFEPNDKAMIPIVREPRPKPASIFSFVWCPITMALTMEYIGWMKEFTMIQREFRHRLHEASIVGMVTLTIFWSESPSAAFYCWSCKRGSLDVSRSLFAALLFSFTIKI